MTQKEKKILRTIVVFLLCGMAACLIMMTPEFYGETSSEPRAGSPDTTQPFF